MTLVSQVKMRDHAAFGIRPLPSHSLQRAEKILRPGCVVCLTGVKPVPSQDGHPCSGALSGRALFRRF
jgi:hypothetical protein